MTDRETDRLLGDKEFYKAAAAAAAVGRWAFAATRQRDGYRTLLTVPVAEHTNLCSALDRARSETGEGWHVSVIDPGISSWV